MNCWWWERFTWQVAARVIADALMVNAAFLIGLTVRFLWLVGIEGSAGSPLTTFHSFVQAYISTFWFLTVVSLIIFYASGLYTHGRFYQGHYKFLVITQAVSASYLIFSLGMFLLWDVVAFSRSVLVLAWFLTLGFLLSARLWAGLWSALHTAELRFLPCSPPEGEINQVLVIGGAGYIGSALVQRLLAQGYRVRVLDLLLYGDAPIVEFYGDPNFGLIRGDFRNIHTVVSACKDVDAIVHLGAIVGDSACSIDEDLTIEINLRATRTIAEIGKGFGVKRFVFASTCSVYGASDEILDERSALNPISLYARTKIESEKVLLSMTDASFAPTILRFGTVYGLSGRPRFDLVVNLLAAKAIQDGEAGIFGGKQWRPFVHVRDVAEAIILTLQAPFCNVRGEILNVGSNQQNFQIADLGLIIKEMIPAARVINQPNEDNRNYRVRFDRIAETLQFQPRYTLRDGITEIKEAYTSGKITDYRDPHYSNFGYLKQNHALHHLLFEDMGALDWVKLSPIDATMLAEVMMAVIESRSPDLVKRLRESLVSAILGDVDRSLNIVAGADLISCARSQVRASLDRQPALAQLRPETRLSSLRPVSTSARPSPAR